MLTSFRSVAIPACIALPCLVAGPSPAAIERPIFVCRSSTEVIFSDRPCGTQAETRVLRIHDPGPGLAASIDAAPPRAATRPRSEPPVAEHVGNAKPVGADNLCRRLREERQRLDDRMRAGYSAREAAQLWNRWREVDAKIYAARC